MKITCWFGIGMCFLHLAQLHLEQRRASIKKSTTSETRNCTKAIINIPPIPGSLKSIGYDV